jgi:hypothetical protein
MDARIPAPGDQVIYVRPADGIEDVTTRRLRTDPAVVVDTDPGSGEVGVFDPESLTGVHWEPAAHWRVVAKATYVDVLSKADGSTHVIAARPASAIDTAGADALIEAAADLRDPERAAYTDGLRQFADLLDAHPEWPMPWAGRGDAITLLFLGADAKEEFAAAARAFPGPLAKRATDKFFDLAGSLHGLKVELTAYRDVVCERVVVGTETVTKQVPDPSVSVPLVEVVETVETVEWVCRPVLAAAAQSEQAGSDL